MNVLLAALECSPFLQVGGVADAVAGLAQGLLDLGHRVTVALPVGMRPVHGPVDGPDLSILEVEGFDASDPYGHEVDATGTQAPRLARLSHAILDLCRDRAAAGVAFDVVHVHDWPVAIVPYLLRQDRTILRPPTTVLTIHNAAFQGLLPLAALAAFGLGPGHADRVGHFGMANLLKAGILASSAVTTVSPGYARQLLAPGMGFGLETPLWERGTAPAGILHGIDGQQWDPMRDPSLSSPFSADDPSGRLACKRALLRELGLEDDPAGFLAVSAGRLFPEKGTDLIAGAVDLLVDRGVRVAIAGAGDPALERSIRDAVRPHPGRAVFAGRAGDGLMRRLLAGADAVLLPSRQEACGMVAIQAQRYGAVPIARRTGGLADLIVDAGSAPESATGWLFEEATVPALVAAVERALATWRSPAWSAIRRRCMQFDRSWTRVAREYELVYRSALGR